MPKRIATLFLLIFMAAQTYAQSLSFTPDIYSVKEEELFGIGGGAEGQYSLKDDFTSRIILDFSFSSKYFGFVAATSFRQDDTYSPDIANTPDGTLFNSYLTIDQGGMVFRGLGMELQLGRLLHKDVIDSPYSLFISSKQNPAMLANFRYENDFAFYESRWIELNHRSMDRQEAKTMGYLTNYDPDTDPYKNGFPERGAQLKTYGIKLGNMRFGFQDAAVYTGRSFDAEYFLNPMLNYLVQYVKGSLGRPWTTGDDENDIMGFFWDWRPNKDLYLDAQVFLDDINLFGIGGTSRNPWKAAYSLGASLQTRYGRFGLHHALATKYCFGSTYDYWERDGHDHPEWVYPWAYYPDTRFLMRDGSFKAIPFDSLMIGYYNGENNLALRLDYDNSLYGFDLAGNLEFVLSGDKSPGNAWHTGNWYKDHSKFLDSETLEKKLALSGQVSRKLNDFTLFGNFLFGIAINAMELQEPYPGETVDKGTGLIDQSVYIWRPGKSTEYLLSISLGLRYDIPVMKALKPGQ